MIRRGLLVAPALLLLGACAYLNSLYNAKRLFRDAEAARREGRIASADALYAQVIEKAARSYRSDEDGRWADDALLLMGRAYMNRGELAKGRAALEEVLRISDDPATRGAARVYLGAAFLSMGNTPRGLALLDSALTAVEDDAVRAEGYLWRARGQFRAGRLDQGWDDLARVGGTDRTLSIQAELERLEWGVELGDSAEARAGAQALLSEPGAEAARDSIAGAVEAANRVWGPATAAALLVGVGEAPWPPSDRDELLLRRARLLASAGDTAAAAADARRIAGGVGQPADEARLLLARWRLAGVRQVDELEEVRSMLLPAVGLPDAFALVEAIKTIGLMIERGGSGREPLALFGAAEVARDVLGSTALARGLFLAYADQARGLPWEGKAVAAALDLARTDEERRALTTRLREMPENAYASAALTGGVPEPQFALLEGRLAADLASIREQVALEAQVRDVLVSETAATLDSIRRQTAIERRIAAGDSALVDSLRMDSLRLDSLRLDSLRLDSILRDSLRLDSIPFDTTSALIPGLVVLFERGDAPPRERRVPVP